MISISVTSFNGGATAPLSGHFDETGGNIGRGENNQLVLPDPERTISRVHAQVVFRNGRYAIIDRGSNPISVNGRPLGNGQETFIQPGDELQIGGYAMRVEAAAAGGGAGAVDPFADFPGLASTPPAGGRAPAAAAALRGSARGLRRRAAGSGGAASGAAPRLRSAAFIPGAVRGRHSPGLGSFRAGSEDDRAARPGLRPLARPAGGRRRRQQFRPRCRRPRRVLDPGVRPGRRWRRGWRRRVARCAVRPGRKLRRPQRRPARRLGAQPGRGAAEHGGARRSDEVAQQHDARQRDRCQRHHARAVDAVHGAADDSDAGAAAAAGRSAAGRAARSVPRDDSVDPDLHLGLRRRAGTR